MIAEQGDEHGYCTFSLFGWQFGQALRSSDTAQARAIVDEALEWQQAFNSNHRTQQDDPRSLMCLYAISHDEITLAAELLDAEIDGLEYEATDYSHIDDDGYSTMRGKYLGFVDRATTLLERPGAKSLPQAPAIDRAARYIGSATQDAMGAMMPVRLKWQALMRTPPIE